MNGPGLPEGQGTASARPRPLRVDQGRVKRDPFPRSPATLRGINDSDRMNKAAKGIVGKRLTYRRTRERSDKSVASAREHPNRHNNNPA